MGSTSTAALEASGPTDQAKATIATPSSQHIRLRVGDRFFTTTRQTLVSESTFFASLLSDRWDSTEAADSHFIDADPTLFEHILRYLRHSVLPVFYEEAKGHDHGLYLALLGEARYFGIPRLEKWLEERHYVNAVQLKHTIELYEDDQSLFGHFVTSSSDTRIEFYPSFGTKKVYVCPRGIYVHRGDSSRCGRQCINARGDDPIEYDEELIARVIVVKKQVIVNPVVCMLDEKI